MPSSLPDGDPAPAHGRLPSSATAELDARSFSAYVHVPFCTVRCGYCDFNTYTAAELGGLSPSTYVEAVHREIELAASVIDGAPPLSTVFFGGGTPTLLDAADQIGVLDQLRSTFGFRPDAEVTTEANPDSVTPTQLRVLREGGINRISFGMQSAVPHVLKTLDRTHDPARLPDVIRAARDAGFDNVSVDLIYGTPGESLDDWSVSLRAALDLQPDHISAYSLIVEPGTALARRIAIGEIAPVDDDVHADMYETADRILRDAGLTWYEVSNWTTSPQARSAHNLAYWQAGNWWGFGPGAHSHVGGVRWWNVKHPSAYADRLASGASPALARETLDEAAKLLERVLLEVRIVDGLDAGVLGASRRTSVETMIDEGLVDADAWQGGRVVLTLRGRLLADLVVRRLTDD